MEYSPCRTCINMSFCIVFSPYEESFWIYDFCTSSALICGLRLHREKHSILFMAFYCLVFVTVASIYLSSISRVCVAFQMTMNTGFTVDTRLCSWTQYSHLNSKASHQPQKSLLTQVEIWSITKTDKLCTNKTRVESVICCSSCILSQCLSLISH